MGKLWRLTIVLALFAVSCRAEANVILAIAEDGSGVSTVELGLDDDLQELLASFTGSDGGLLPGFDFGALLGVEGDLLDSSPLRVEDEMTFWGTSRSFATLEELEALVVTATGQFTFDTFDISLEDEEISVTAAAGAPGDLIGDIELPSSLDLFESALSANVIIGMPGNVGENNADMVLPDGRLSWDISLTQGVDIQAVADLSESSFPLWIIAVIVLLLAALALAIVVMRRNSAIPAETLAETDAPPEPMGFVRGPPDDEHSD